MIFLDANIFIRILATPATPQDSRMAAAATVLFDQIERGEIEGTTSEATIAEVAFILTDKRHYAGLRTTAAAGLRSLLHSKDFRLDSKPVVFRALELWSMNEKISFPDGLAAAYSEIRGDHVATFDKRLQTVPTVTLHQFRQT